MNRTAAKLKAESETLTVGELRSMIVQASGKGGMGRVNSSVPMSQCCKIYLAALDGRPDTEIPKAWVMDGYTGRQRAGRDKLIMVNILRDCG